MLRIQHCLDNRLIDGGKVVSPTHLPDFTPRNIPVLISVTLYTRRWKDIIKVNVREIEFGFVSFGAG
jgi:hypothetical protein